MRYPSLPRIVIPIACAADWNTMRAIETDGRARLCPTCDTPVYDSRSMTRGELYRLIVKHEGSLPCLRLRRRPDGTIITGSCFAPMLRAGRLLWLQVALAAVAFWSAVFAFRSWMGRPKSNPAPALVAAPPSPAPEAVTVTIHVDPDKAISRPPLQPEYKGYTTGRPRHATMGKGKVTSNRKLARGDHSLDDLLKGL
jgi:hypothetical protein